MPPPEGSGSGGAAERVESSAETLREDGERLRTGSSYQIVVQPLLGTIWATLADWVDFDPLAETPYTIRGVPGEENEELTGTTDSEGVLRHEDVPIGYYILATEEDETTVFSEIEPEYPASVRMPFTEPPEDVYEAHMIDEDEFQVGDSDDGDIRDGGED